MNTATLKLAAAEKADSKSKAKAVWNYNNNTCFLLKMLLTAAGFIIAIVVTIFFRRKQRLR